MFLNVLNTVCKLSTGDAGARRERTPGSEFKKGKGGPEGGGFCPVCQGTLTPLTNWRRILPGFLANFMKKLTETFSPSKTEGGGRVEAGKGLKAGVPRALGQPLALTSAFAPACLTVPHSVWGQGQSSLPSLGQPGRAG